MFSYPIDTERIFVYATHGIDTICSSNCPDAMANDDEVHRDEVSEFLDVTRRAITMVLKAFFRLMERRYGLKPRN